MVVSGLLKHTVPGVNMKWIAVLTAAFVVGCASPDAALQQFHQTENQYFYNSAGSDKITVQWIRVSDQRLQRICATMTQYPIRPGTVLLGCAGVDLAGTCIVYTGTNTSHQLLGHEVRHCFQGNFHR